LPWDSPFAIRSWRRVRELDRGRESDPLLAVREPGEHSWIEKGRMRERRQGRRPAGYWYRSTGSRLTGVPPDLMKAGSAPPDELGGRGHGRQTAELRTAAWDSLERLSGELEDTVWGHLAGTTSAPFTKGESGERAVKVIDRGNGLLVVKKLARPG
jgi:hypothetical protein